MEMKSRLGASISQLFAVDRFFSICRGLSVKPKFALFHSDRQSNLLFLLGFKSLKRSLHISFVEEDDFSELGPPVALSTGKLPKLVTEKPELFVHKTDPARKAMAGRSCNAESKPSMKNILPGLSKPSPSFSPKAESNDITILSNDSKGACNVNNSNSISIENVPVILDLAQLIEAILIFGKISSASMRSLPNGLSCCDVEFEDVRSSWRASTVGWITVRNFHLPIRPLYVPETVRIRIWSINKESTDPIIHSICKSIGALEGLVRSREDMVDAFFSLKDDPDIECILKKLNNTILDNCPWSACLLPRNSTPTVMSRNEDAKFKLGLEIDNYVAELKRQFCMKRLYAEDLQILHKSIMHLEGQPAVLN